jgi:hypothetical protein
MTLLATDTLLRVIRMLEVLGNLSVTGGAGI